ncbi:receptor-like protein Cf-9 homolog [Ipomoea triloba]|uniref:receptor-like protein Cf-9 homolog n=1 Tax=Ipomoea triloba TaxID=35885 RepID=UPI00125E499D|nr:receptor-like protein Cf-9 homolog [Ipomoea triloba]XP_031111462.1 receptor-like protein Cf-9 homolog [Ipomoea triloba]
MGSQLLLLLVIQCLLFLISFVSLSTSALCQNDQQLALLHFKQSFTIDPSPPDYCAQISTIQVSNEGVQNSYPKTISWNSSIDCCLWDGVTCDESTGQVVELDLSCSQLLGTIDSNSTLFHLSHLQKLNLAGNRFDGSFISHKFGDFSYLTHLNLSSSRLSGQIPSKILHLPNLISLDLGDTFYSSSLFEIGNHDFMFLLQNATQLRELVLDGIPIHSSIPPNVSSSITTLSLSYTKLQGSLPTNIFHLPNLQKLLLQGNENLSIHFPSTRWNSSLSLSYLDLGSTGCPPNIIESLRNLSRVKYLGLANCGLSGKVSEAILDLEQLTALDLSGNSLEGGVADLLIKLWRLKRLFLYSNSFTAQFPSSITNITQLEVLDLSNSSLYGTIPSWLFNHSTLYILDLSSNQLQGSIPTSSLSKQKNLIILNLSSNNFSGTVELNMFSNLKRIMVLRLSNNRLSLVSNPKINSTSWLENLISLSLSSCNLTNLNFLRDSKYLRNLDLSNNKIQGRIPELGWSNSTSWLENLNSLRLASCNLTNLNFLRDSKFIEYLDLSNNKIQGRIPEWAWSNWQDTLWYLNLSHNHLTSVEGIQLHSIIVIDLQFNLLEGPLPIPSSPSLRYYFASQNKLSGEVPFTVCNLSHVQILDLATNNLSGAIPQCLGNSSEFLEVLDLHNNQFRGSIPSTFFTSNKLHTLNLRGNKLEGRIPQSLANCTNLVVLDLGENNLSSIFPEWLLKLPKLQVLSLRFNHFHGTITTSPTKHLSSQLKIIDLSHNEFTGNLPIWLFKSFTAMKNTDEAKKSPSYFGVQRNYYKDSLVLEWKGNELNFLKILTVLTTVDLSSNKFEGKIPDDVGQLISLRGLNLSHNMLIGCIPRSFRKLSALESLDLSSNQLVGEIPKELAPLTFLSVFKLSHNHLTGCIPKGNQFNTFEKSSYEGNDGLRGYPMTKDCGNGVSSQPPTVEVLHQEDNVSILYGFTWKVVLLGYGCGTVFGMIMGSLMHLSRKPFWITRIVEEEGYKIMRKENRKKSKTPRSGRRRI